MNKPRDLSCFSHGFPTRPFTISIGLGHKENSLMAFGHFLRKIMINLIKLPLAPPLNQFFNQLANTNYIDHRNRGFPRLALLWFQGKMAVEQQGHSLSCLMTPVRTHLFPGDSTSHLPSTKQIQLQDAAAWLWGTRKREIDMLPGWNRGSQEGPQHISGRCLGHREDGGFEERNKGRRLKMSSNVKM